MILVTGDLETFWSPTHSLSKMNPIEYVTHQETELISNSLKIGDAPATCVFGEAAIREQLNAVNWDDAYFIAHNMSGFDAMVYAWRLGIRPRLWGCTLAMARPIHAKTIGVSLATLVKHYGIGVKNNAALLNTKGKHLADFSLAERRDMARYNNDDTEQCYQLFKLLRPHYSGAELWHLDSKIRSLVEPGFVVDVPMMEAALEQERKNKRQVLVSLAGMFAKQVMPVGDIADASEDYLVERVRATLASAPMFCQVLEARGVPVPMKQSPTNEDVLIPALAKKDLGFIELQEHPDEVVAMAATARLSVKSTIAESRMEKVIEVAGVAGGNWPVTVSYCGADTTGRSSGWLYNPLNLPKINSKKPKPSDALRLGLMAPPGHKVVVVDSSGIEMRFNHFLWNVRYSTDLWKSDATADIYKPTAAAFFGCTVEEVDSVMRQVGKVQQLACIEEGSLVLTERGLIPIEQVPVDVRVWDGVEWVHHDGPIYQGERDVISYDSLTATPDHIVYLRDGTSCQFGDAAREGREIARTGNGRTPLRACGDSVHRRAEEGQALASSHLLSDVRRGEVDQPGFDAPRHQRVRSVQSATFCSEVAGAASDGGEAALYQPEQSSVQVVRGERGGVPVQDSYRSSTLGAGEPGPAQGQGAGSSEELRPLRGGESTLVAEAYQPGEPREVFLHQGVGLPCGVPEGEVRGQHVEAAASFWNDACRNSCAMGTPVLQTKRRVWDLLNAGPRHRFTVQGLLVSNCGFGCGPDSYVTMARSMAGIILTRDEAAPQVNGWRSMTPEIADRKEGGWARCDEALAWIMEGMERPIDPRGIFVTCAEGIRLPSGRLIRYPALRRQKVMRKRDGTLKDEWTTMYGEGRHQVYIYGAKADENIVQAGARDVVYDAAFRIFKRTGYRPALEVYDELAYVVPEDKAEQHLAICHEELRRSPDWFPDLILWSEGDIGDRYGEAK